jgi:hypothetical protein
MSNITLNQGTRKRVVVLISSLAIFFLGEEADVVTLSAHDNCELDLFKS